MLASGDGQLSPREGLNDIVQAARLLGQSKTALNSPRKVNVSPNEVQLTACSQMALKSIVLIFPSNYDGLEEDALSPLSGKALEVIEDHKHFKNLGKSY